MATMRASRRTRETSTLRCWDNYWKKKWEEERELERKKFLTTSKNYGIIKM